MTVLFLACGVPNGVFVIPTLTFLVGKFIIGSNSTAFVALGILLLPLAILPQSFVPSVLQSWLAIRVAKYFSFRFIFEDRPPPKNPQDPRYRPRILVAQTKQQRGFDMGYSI